MSNENTKDYLENARHTAPENVAHFMEMAEQYVGELNIEEMDRTQFLGTFAQACLLDQHLSAIRAELSWLTDEVSALAEILSK